MSKSAEKYDYITHILATCAEFGFELLFYTKRVRICSYQNHLGYLQQAKKNHNQASLTRREQNPGGFFFRRHFSRLEVRKILNGKVFRLIYFDMNSVRA